DGKGFIVSNIKEAITREIGEATACMRITLQFYFVSNLMPHVDGNHGIPRRQRLATQDCGEGLVPLFGTNVSFFDNLQNRAPDEAAPFISAARRHGLDNVLDVASP